jgi:hypothetical protein
MVADKRLDSLQEEIKLLKGELKNSLASVRDYLLNQELPSAELSGLSGFYGDGEQKISVKSSVEPAEAAAAEIGSGMMPDLPGQAEAAEDIPPEDEELISVEPPLQEEEVMSEESPVARETAVDSPEDTLSSEEEYYPPEQDKRPDEREAAGPREQGVPMDYVRAADTSPSTPRVNMLANLITWVARAKNEIGHEQLATFLEVYGLSGHLSPELKEVILHFAEITSGQPEAPVNAEVWSQAMLSLHGILTGGDAPLHPAVPTWAQPAAEEPAAEEEELIEVDRPPVKLKLVFPDGEGKSKEYCIDLTPEADNGGRPPNRGG